MHKEVVQMGASCEIGIEYLLGQLHAVLAGIEEMQGFALGEVGGDVRLGVYPVEELLHLGTLDLRKASVLGLQVGFLHDTLDFSLNLYIVYDNVAALRNAFPAAGGRLSNEIEIEIEAAFASETGCRSAISVAVVVVVAVSAYAGNLQLAADAFRLRERKFKFSVLSARQTFIQLPFSFLSHFFFILFLYFDCAISKRRGGRKLSAGTVINAWSIMAPLSTRGVCCASPGGRLPLHTTPCVFFFAPATRNGRLINPLSALGNVVDVVSETV